MRKQGRKQGKKIGSDPILCSCADTSYIRKKTGSDPVFGFVQIKRPFLRTTRDNIIPRRLLRRFLGVRTTCELANYQPALRKDDSHYLRDSEQFLEHAGDSPRRPDFGLRLIGTGTVPYANIASFSVAVLTPRLRV